MMRKEKMKHMTEHEIEWQKQDPEDYANYLDYCEEFFEIIEDDM